MSVLGFKVRIRFSLAACILTHTASHVYSIGQVLITFISDIAGTDNRIFISTSHNDNSFLAVLFTHSEHPPCKFYQQGWHDIYRRYVSDIFDIFKIGYFHIFSTLLYYLVLDVKTSLKCKNRHFKFSILLNV